MATKFEGLNKLYSYVLLYIMESSNLISYEIKVYQIDFFIVQN